MTDALNETYEKIHQLNQDAWESRNSDYAASIRMAKQAQAMLAECSELNLLELSTSLRTQAYCLEASGEFDDAVRTGLRAMDIANQSGDLLCIAEMDNVMGNIFWRMDDFSSALNHYMHGLELLQKHPNPELEVYLVQGLGIIYHSMGVYEEAQKYFELSIEISFPEDGIGRAIGLNNLAFALTEMGRSEEALPYALKSTDLHEQGGYPISEVLHTMGSIYLNIGKIDQASDFFNRSLQIAEQLNNRLQKANALVGMAQVHLARGEREIARETLLKVLRVSQGIGLANNQECAAHELLAKIYKQVGDYQAALAQYEAFHALYVHRYNEQSYRRIHNAQVLREVEIIRKQADLYRKLAATDSLTGLLSRREFFELGIKAVQDAQTREASVAVLMIDVDYFKEVNDRYGHPVGDQVLMQIAARLKKVLRHADLAGRYGGDEFVILLPESGEQQGRKISERCRREIAKAPFEINTLKISLTISVGLAVSDPCSPVSLEDLIRLADQGLLLKKKAR